MQMQDFLRKKAKDGPAHVSRDEIEIVGSNMGLCPDEADRLFQSLEGDHWWGDYIAVDEEKGWVAVRLTDVR